MNFPSSQAAMAISAKADSYPLLQFHLLTAILREDLWQQEA